MPDTKLKGKVVLVTGANNPHGRLLEHTPGTAFAEPSGDDGDPARAKEEDHEEDDDQDLGDSKGSKHVGRTPFSPGVVTSQTSTGGGLLQDHLRDGLQLHV